MPAIAYSFRSIFLKLFNIFMWEKAVRSICKPGQLRMAARRGHTSLHAGYHISPFLFRSCWLVTVFWAQARQILELSRNRPFQASNWRCSLPLGAAVRPIPFIVSSSHVRYFCLGHHRILSFSLLSLQILPIKFWYKMFSQAVDFSAILVLLTFTFSLLIRGDCWWGQCTVFGVYKRNTHTKKVWDRFPVLKS